MYALYTKRLGFRLIIFIATLLISIFKPYRIRILSVKEFFTSFTYMHFLWLVFVAEMSFHLIDNKFTTLGSKKYREKYLKLPENKYNKKAVRQQSDYMTKQSGLVFIVWTILTIAIGALYKFEFIGFRALIMISLFFYVADYICILFWCPFQAFFLKNRCCVTCPIFNWDFLMMFAPFIFVKSFFTRTLFLFATVIFFIWDYSTFKHPERFNEISNENLKCKNCKEQLCKMKRKLNAIK